MNYRRLFVFLVVCIGIPLVVAFAKDSQEAKAVLISTQILLIGINFMVDDIIEAIKNK